jgi:BlaI family transcriptional regulator, penicillinase repressor
LSTPRLSRLELRIMNAFWRHGSASVREIHESFPDADRPAYTTVQTIVSRLEEKKALRRVKKVGNAFLFEPAISQEAAQRRLIDDLLALFGGRTEPVMAHLIESGKLTRDDLRQAQETFRRMAKRQKPE